MSWLSQNYEKAAIGGAAVVALGLAALGWSKVSSVDNDFAAAATAEQNREAEVAGADRVVQASSVLQADFLLPQAQTETGRGVDLFTGVPLFVDRDEPEKGLDLPIGPPVHAPIPNVWWLEHQLDPGFADSPQRDPDGEGFSNLEEFLWKTDPNDPASYPPLVAKLKYLREESLRWVLRPTTQEAGGFAFEYADTAGGTNRQSIVSPIKPGELFFKEGAMKERFKLLGSETREELNPRTNAKETNTWVQIEDQRPNKKGKVYELPLRFSRDLEELYQQFDRTAVFSLEAIGQSGQEFNVEENTAFALPQGEGEMDHLLKSVTPESVEVEFPAADGERRTVPIPQGGMPVIDP